MKDKKDYAHIDAEILHELRNLAHLSKAKMADKLFLDERTYGRYESGESSPSLPEALVMLDRMDVPALPTILKYLQPETYGDLSPKAPEGNVRQALADYVLHNASDRDVRQLAYILLGPHGSSVDAQLQLFCAIDHLPMDARLMIAKLTLNAWEIEASRGDTINPDYAQPDIELLREAIIRAHNAVIEGRSHYGTPIK